MQPSILFSLLLAVPALAAPAGDLFGRSESDFPQCWNTCMRGCPGNPNICSPACAVACANAGEADEAAVVVAREAVTSAGHPLVARSNYVECHQNCVRGCTGSPNICQAVCNIACANAGEAEEAVALAARETVSLAVREAEASVGSLVARSNYVECHQNCVRGCTGQPNICQAVCNIACANAGEAGEKATLAARESEDPVPNALVTRSNYVECHQNCVRGCTGSPNICQAVCNIACANAGEAEGEVAALAAREAVSVAEKSLATRKAESSHGHSLLARSNYVECHQNCVRGCTGSPNICQAACNAACANAGEAEE